MLDCRVFLFQREPSYLLDTNHASLFIANFLCSQIASSLKKQPNENHTRAIFVTCWVYLCLSVFCLVFWWNNVCMQKDKIQYCLFKRLMEQWSTHTPHLPVKERITTMHMKKNIFPLLGKLIKRIPHPFPSISRKQNFAENIPLLAS